MPGVVIHFDSAFIGTHEIDGLATDSGEPFVAHLNLYQGDVQTVSNSTIGSVGLTEKAAKHMISVLESIINQGRLF
jgi:hypothetical protein